MSQAASKKLSFYDLEPETTSLYDDVIEGLNKTSRAIPPKYFYDEQGSRLFDDICETAEYYPTRTEMRIIEENLEEISHCIGSGCVLIEPGSGSSQKVRLLLDSVEPHTYMPLDISSDYLQSVAQGLAQEYPRLNVAAACVDYTAPLELPHCPVGMSRVAFFPGSSIGNFEPEDAIGFLSNIADMVQPGGGLLIGVDLKKSPEILNAAYDDKQGITAAFNLNILTRINAELNANFNLDAFQHKAFYNDRHGRVEMHLVSRQAQMVNISGKRFRFEAGDSIHTENSYKYAIDEFHALAKQAGFEAQRVWTDAEELFSIHYFRCVERK